MTRWALIAALSVLLAGCGVLPHVPSTDAPASSSAPATTTTAPVVVLVPTSVSVPSIGAKSSLVATHKNPDGTAEVPPVDQPLQASYLDWADSIEAERPLVIYGHVNGRDAAHRSVPGVFAKLSTIKVGDVVTVTFGGHGIEDYRITRTQQIRKTAFPTGAVYDATPGRTIRLVTCDGTFDSGAGSYLDNFIAYGDLVPA